MRFRHEGAVESLHRTWSQKVVHGVDEYPSVVPLGSPAWLSDWFINGPHLRPYTRLTRRREYTRISQQRDFGNVQTDEQSHGGDGRDHFVVDTGDVRFAVCQVPEEFAPDWCHPISIEFRTPIPDVETRDAITEIVSFVLGRRLLRVGSTLFDETAWPIEDHVVSLFGQDARNLCAESANRSIPLDVQAGGIEAVLGHLVPKYLKAREPMGLRNALWGYWISCEAPPPIDLALFGAALEALKKGWFNSRGEKSDGTYMPKDEFEPATKDVFTTVEERIGKHGSAKQILDNLRRAYQKSGNEEVRAFLSAINLPVGKAEHKARREANDPAHGEVTTKGNIKESVHHARVYRTLFVRAFLRELDYDGLYVDRGTLGFPSRRLDKPVGGDAG